MAIIQIKSEKLSPFGGIFSIMEQFDSTLSSVIDSTLGMRCRLYGYQYSEIIRSLMSVYFLFSTLIAVNGRKSLKINKVTLCIWIFGWRKLSLHHVRTQETPQIRCL